MTEHVFCPTSGNWQTRRPGCGRRRSTSTTRWRANCGWAAFPASQRSGCQKSCTISRSITRR
ncbi:hypothetical protein [uncultured Faecalibacterium sp.]|uniref:hypothetical protein n=1 Tax=uncultured Faecalibacterium sp. TaxID=259315 RepID=UPI0035A6F0B5